MLKRRFMASNKYLKYNRIKINKWKVQEINALKPKKKKKKEIK